MGLVLSRVASRDEANPKRRLRIRFAGVEVVVSVIRINDNQVGLHFDAPKGVEILREEIIDREEHESGS